MKVTKLVTLTCALAIAALVGTEAHAGGRPDSSSRDWFGHISGGYGFTNGTTGDFLDDDWTFGGGAIYWPSSWRAGIALDINYGRFDLSNQALRAINDAIDADPGNAGEITGGDVQNWQFGLRGIWSLGANQSDAVTGTAESKWQTN